MGNCPVCGEGLGTVEESPRRGAYCDIKCPNCGPFQLTDAVSYIGSQLRDGRERAIVSHAIKTAGRGGDPPTVHSGFATRVLETEKLPGPAEQARNLILWLGTELEQKGRGTWLNVNNSTLRATIGALDASEVAFIRESVVEEGLVEKQRMSDELTRFRLTFRGWERFEELRRSVENSRKAFMAMPYGHGDLDSVYKEHFKPAVEATGFDLGRLDEEPKAGIIDARLEVEIRTARFVIADLTHDNPNVYWEAGFATGLGKPVIYTCREDECKDVRFDTSHWQRVQWSMDRLRESTEMLKAAIRATLPTEAKMED